MRLRSRNPDTEQADGGTFTLIAWTARIASPTSATLSHQRHFEAVARVALHGGDGRHQP